MDTSYKNTAIPIGGRTFENSELQLQPASIGKYVLIALGIITLLSCIVTSICLYTQIGNWSLLIGSGGLIVGLALVAIGRCCNSTISSQPHTGEKFPSRVPLSLVDLEEIRGQEKSLPHQPLDPFPALGWNSNKPLSKMWFSRNEFMYYTAYLSMQFSNIPTIGVEELSQRCDVSINGLREYIFDYLPSKFTNFNNLDIPVDLLVSNNHWTLVYIDRQRRTVEYYDSKEKYGNHDEIVHKLTSIAEELSKQESNQPPYQFICKINRVLQPDIYQCGPWMLYFLENRLINPDFDFNTLNIDEAQNIIKAYREKVILQIYEMLRTLIAIQQQEDENYLQYYKEKELAKEMLAQDYAQILLRDRWKQILNSQPLIPGEKISSPP